MKFLLAVFPLLVSSLRAEDPTLKYFSREEAKRVDRLIRETRKKDKAQLEVEALCATMGLIFGYKTGGIVLGCILPPKTPPQPTDSPLPSGNK